VRHRVPASPDVEVVIDQYAQWMRSWAAADKTISARTSLAQSRLDAWGLDGFTPDNIQAFLGREGLSKWTRATYRSNIGSFCEYLVAAGHLAASPMKEVRAAKRPRSQPRPLSETELALVLHTATGRNRDWIVLALNEGLRAHEIAKLRGEDVDAEGVFVCGKGGVEATLPTHPEVLAMAQRYPSTGWWFPSPYGGHIKAETVSATISVMFTALGIKGSIHRVRHNYGTRLLRNGENIRRVQKLMRHASLGSTEGYTAVDEDELRQAINRLPWSA